MQHLVVAFMSILAMYRIPPLNPRELNAVCLSGGVHKLVCLERGQTETDSFEEWAKGDGDKLGI